MRRRLLLLLWLPLACTNAVAAAQDATPVGLWRSIDDETGRPRALIRIYEQDGKLFGKVEDGLVKGEPPDQVCDKCTDERKGMKKIGMVIIRNLTRDGDVWDGGDILDPDNGKVYRCRLRVVDDNRSLEVRGYVGFALLGRTQVWERVE